MLLWRPPNAKEWRRSAVVALCFCYFKCARFRLCRPTHAGRPAGKVTACLQQSTAVVATDVRVPRHAVRVPQCIYSAQHEEHERNMTRQPRRKEQTFTEQGSSRQMAANDLDRPRAMLYVFGPGCGHGAVSKHSGKEYRPPSWVRHACTPTTTRARTLLANQPSASVFSPRLRLAMEISDLGVWQKEGAAPSASEVGSAWYDSPVVPCVHYSAFVVFRSHIRQRAEQAEGRTAMRACACVDGRRPR